MRSRTDPLSAVRGRRCFLELWAPSWDARSTPEQHGGPGPHRHAPFFQATPAAAAVPELVAKGAEVGLGVAGKKGGGPYGSRVRVLFVDVGLN